MLGSVRSPLPVDGRVPDVLEALARAGSAVVTAPPASGKSTRLPLALLERGLPGDGQLWLLQPRRVAARAAARRMAAELGEEVGRTVGFVTRDGSAVSAATRVVVATEGVLTRKLLADPALPGVSAVMLDEFHERGRQTDLVLAMSVESRATVREDLWVLVASATLDPGPVSAYLGRAGAPAPVVAVEAPVYPVEVRWAEAVSARPLPERAAWAALRALDELPSGDVLVFLPGAGEIRRTAGLLAGSARRSDLAVVPLHGDLPPAEQDRALLPDPAGRRKAVLATNVAETSLTIEGVSAVVDGGLARVLRFDARTGIDRLVLSPVSRASAVQRAGRAGRLGPGVVFRLYTREEERGFRDREEPELLRTDLAPALLDVLGWAARDPRRFGWFEAPPASAMEAGLALLRRLGAVRPDGHELTPLGRRMSQLPLHPRLSAVLLSAQALGRPRRGALLVALLSEREVLASRRALWQGEAEPSLPTSDSDLLARMDLVEEVERSGAARERMEALGLEPGAVRSVLAARDRILRLAGGGARGPEQGGDEELRRALLAGYPDRVGRRLPGGSRLALVGGTGAVLDPGSCVREAPLVLAVDVTAGGSGPARVRTASSVEASWLGARTETVRRWDREGGTVVAERRLVYEGLVLSEQPVPAPLDGETSALLAGAALEDPRAVFADEPDLADLERRLAFLGPLRPDLGLPAPGEGLRAELVREASEGRRRLSELRQVRLAPLLLRKLGAAGRRALDDGAPPALRVPTGRDLRVDYSSGRPVLAVKLQEMFGLAETPRVAGGRVPVVLHLLSPAGRPVQVTTDLTGFWRSGYAAVRRELRGRYPKHPWPEDPTTAPPQAGTRRRPG